MLAVGDEMEGMMEERIKKALEVATWGGVDGSHHKQWVIDQMVRVLAGDGYGAWLDEYTEGGEYEWDEGIAP